MIEQLDLLSYQPLPEEMHGPEPLATHAQNTCTNQHAIAFLQAKAAVYLRLMANIARSNRLPPEVRRFEVSRLHQIRKSTLEQIDGDRH